MCRNIWKPNNIHMLLFVASKINHIWEKFTHMHFLSAKELKFPFCLCEKYSLERKFCISKVKIMMTWVNNICTSFGHWSPVAYSPLSSIACCYTGPTVFPTLLLDLVSPLFSFCVSSPPSLRLAFLLLLVLSHSFLPFKHLPHDFPE